VPPRVDPGAREFAAAVQRRTARLAVNGQVQVAISGLDLTLELRDLSFGGFGMTAPRPFWKGMTHRFVFSTPAGRSISLVAKMIHCSAVRAEQGYISGWEFMPGTSDRTEKAIGDLLDAVVPDWGGNEAVGQ
jgi:hypothetical protein